MTTETELLKVTVEALARQLDDVESRAARQGYRYEEAVSGRELDRVFMVASLALADIAATFDRLAVEHAAFLVEERSERW